MGAVKRLVAIGMCILLLLPCMTGCSGATDVEEYLIPEDIDVMDSGIVAENNNYEMEWDADMSVVLLRNKVTGDVWSTVPYDFYLEEDENVDISSPLFIRFYTPEDGSLQPAKAYYDCIDAGLVNVSPIDNGLKMTFYFEEPQITVPLNFTLRDDSMQVSLPLGEVVESGMTQLVSVSILPYMCAAPNVTDRSNYVMLPVGSGALMYTDEDLQYNSRAFTAKVFGTDPATIVMENVAEEQAVRLPVYGVKDGEKALLSIIEQGAGAATLNGEVGTSKDYSTAYTTFQVRGNDVTEAIRVNYQDRDVYQKFYDKEAVYSIGYYPLSGDKANYVGMAERYRQYLTETDNFIDSTITQKPYRLDFLGSSKLKKFIAGFPYYAQEAATTTAQVETIVNELISLTGKTPAVTLTGFGKSGLTPGSIGGGYGIASAVGGNKGHAALETFCKNAGIDLYTDFDLVQFSEGGNGFNVMTDTARTPSMQIATSYPLMLNFRNQNKDSGTRIRLLSRANLTKAVAKLKDLTGGTMSGVSLNTLGQMAYSDYSRSQYYLAGNLREQIVPLLKELRENGNTLSFAEPNSYAAGMADIITDAPLQNGNYQFLDETIPFYEIVFAGSKALYTGAVNLSPDAKALLLRAIEAGVSPSFTLTGNYTVDFADAETEHYGSLYASNKDTVTALIAQYAPYFEKVGGKAITAHEVPAAGVSKTTFENGTILWINHTEKPVTFAEGYTIAAGEIKEGVWYVAPEPLPEPDSNAPVDPNAPVEPDVEPVV